MALILSGDTGPSFVQAAAMPAGSVIQTVVNNFGTYLAGTNGSYADVTGFYLTITPTSATSKILIMYSINGLTTSQNAATSYPVYFQLADGSNNQIVQLMNNYVPGGNQNYGVDGYSGSYLHSPATTSTLTYKIRVKDDGASHGWQLNNYATTAANYSSLVAMEIKQ